MARSAACFVVAFALAVTQGLACTPFDATQPEGPAETPPRDASASVPEASVDDAGTRVATGLVALYTFREGSGSKVSDVSGVAPPLDLIVQDPASASWGAEGLTLTGTRARSRENATKISVACRASNQLSVEAWIKPTSKAQGGPARIVTLASNDATLSTLLGLGDSNTANARASYVYRLASGAKIDVFHAPETARAQMQHVVATAAAPGMARLYVDGVVEPGFLTGTGFARWTDHPLSLGDELVPRGDGISRYFAGTYALVAVYCRELSQAEVLANHVAGPRP